MSIDGTLYRQWAMLRLIPRHPRRISATDLTSQLNELGYVVNKRTVERDLKMFEEIFGLVADDRSRPFGWQWGHDNPGLDIPSLDDGQALMLSVAEPFIAQLLPPPVLEALRPAMGAAKRKLKESVGAKHLKKWTEKIYNAPPSQPLMPARVVPGAQEVVGMALLRDQWLRIRYRKRSVTESATFDVQPLGLVTRGPMLYLICRFRGYTDERTIALSRLEHVEMLPEAFRRPEEFSLKAYVEQGRMGLGNCRVSMVVLRFASHQVDQVIETPLSANQEVTQEGTTTLISAYIPITPDLKRWVLGFGSDVQVIGPESFRREIIRAIEGMHERYG